MKFGLRDFNFDNRLKGRTTTRATKMSKGAFNPLYGKKGMGWINNPKKAAYNKVYKKTSFSLEKALKAGLFFPFAILWGICLLVFWCFMVAIILIQFTGYLLYQLCEYIWTNHLKKWIDTFIDNRSNKIKK